jgi:hypothetical protein
MGISAKDRARLAEDEFIDEIYDVDDGTFSLYLETSEDGKKKRIVWENRGEVRAQSWGKLIGKKAGDGREEAILASVFDQIWSSENGVSTNIPTDEEDYAEGTTPQQVIDVLIGDGLAPDYVDVSLAPSKGGKVSSFGELEDCTVMLGYLLQFDMSDRGSWIRG